LGTPIDDLVVRVVRARLARPDFAGLLTDTEREDTQGLTGELSRLRARLESIDADYDAGLIDGHRYRVASEKVRAEAARVEGELARATAGKVWASAGPDPVAAFDAAPLMTRRAMVAGLVDVRVDPWPRGRRGFDPRSVRITPAEF
jgi:hypothetical protein